MSAPAKYKVRNPRESSNRRHPFIQVSNRPGSAFVELMADPHYRRILFAENGPTLAKAGYTEESESARRTAARRQNAFLDATPGEVKVKDRATSSRGWHAIALGIDRGKLPPACLLEPDRKAYPVCGNDGKLSCQGLRAAKSRAHINAVHGVPGAEHVEETAKRLISKYCETSSPSASASSAAPKKRGRSRPRRR